MKETKGITLVALVITIIVLLILAGVTVATLFGDDGVITKAEVAKMKTEFATIKEQFDLFSVNEEIKSKGEYIPESLSASGSNLVYNTKPGTEGSIYDVIPDLKNSKYKDNFEIIKGDLIIDSVSKKEQEIAESVGIIVSPYIIIDGVLMSANDNLGLMDETGTVTIPSKVTAIGEGAFADVDGIKTVIIPGTVKEIRKNAFAGNKTLEKVVMQDGVEIIGESAFRECTSLVTIEMTNSVKTLGSSVFWGCRKLENIDLSENITRLPDYAFYYNNALKNIVIPENVTMIGSGVFTYCSSLTKINIPKNVNSIVGNVFLRCTNLEMVTVDQENTNFSSEDGMLMKKDKTKIIYVPKGAINGNVFEIPGTVTSFDTNLLSDYTTISTLKIPASVNNINFGSLHKTTNNIIIDPESQTYTVSNGIVYSKDETMVHYYFKNETSVELPDKVVSIGDYAFYLAANLTNIKLPEKLTTIKSQAFNGTPNLKEIALGKNVSDINALAFYASSIDKIIIDPENPNYVFEGGALYNKDKTKLINVIKIGSVTEFTIPEGIEEIGSYAFHNQNKMTKVTIPNTVKKIFNSFSYCASLTTIEIPSSVTYIHPSCFVNSGMREIRVHNEKGSIPGAPWGCILGDRGVIWLGKE